MKKGKQRLLRWGGLIILLAVAAAVIYLTSFYQADVLKVKEDRLVGAKPTWLTGYFAEKGQEARYYKLADVTAPKNYTADRDAVDPDGDPLTTFFSFVGKNRESEPENILIQALPVPLETLATGTGVSACGECVLEDVSGYLSREEEENQKRLIFYMASPYQEASLSVCVSFPAEEDEETAMALLRNSVGKVVPGKQLSPLAADFKLNFLDDSRWAYLWNGLIVTLEITLCAVLIGILIGTVIATVRSTWDQNSENMRPGPGRIVLSWVNSLCKLYLTVIRGTPVVIQLMIMYYIIFSTSRNGVLIAILAFGINSGAYVAEIIRGGIMSIDRGQLEAGRSLGFNYVQTMRHIIIPQAMKNVLPALANEFIVLLKETSVSGYVAVKDLTKGGDIIRGVTYSAFMPLLAVAAIYLILVMFFTALVGKLERRLRSSDH